MYMFIVIFPSGELLGCTFLGIKGAQGREGKKREGGGG